MPIHNQITILYEPIHSCSVQYSCIKFSALLIIQTSHIMLLEAWMYSSVKLRIYVKRHPHRGQYISTALISYMLMDEKSPIFSFFPQSFLSISCQLFPLLLMFSSTWPNHIVLDHSISVLPLNFKSNDLSVLVLCLLLRGQMTVIILLLTLLTNSKLQLL